MDYRVDATLESQTNNEGDDIELRNDLMSGSLTSSLSTVSRLRLRAAMRDGVATTKKQRWGSM
jgi:hypothetical protein